MISILKISTTSVAVAGPFQFTTSCDLLNVDFTFSIADNGRTVTFYSSNSIGDSLYWDFGDGFTGYGDSITYTYADSIYLYQPCLTIFQGQCYGQFCDPVFIFPQLCKQSNREFNANYG